MFRTVTSNPLLITQGSHLCISQEQVDDKNKIQRRYVILDSQTLEAKTFATKELYDAAIVTIIEAHQKPKKASALDELGTAPAPNVSTLELAKEPVPDEFEADDDTVQP